MTAIYSTAFALLPETALQKHLEVTKILQIFLKSFVNLDPGLYQTNFLKYE